MTRLRRTHLAAALLVGLAVALLLYGHLRAPIAILSLVCLALVISAEAFRVRTDPLDRKDDR